MSGLWWLICYSIFPVDCVYIFTIDQLSVPFCTKISRYAVNKLLIGFVMAMFLLFILASFAMQAILQPAREVVPAIDHFRLRGRLMLVSLNGGLGASGSTVLR